MIRGMEVRKEKVCLLTILWSIWVSSRGFMKANSGKRN